MIRKYGKEPFNIAVVHGGPGACGSVACIAKELSKISGAVEPIQSKYNIAELIDELHTQINEITSVPITLLGHSWGAWLVVLYASQYPKLVKQIVLVGSGPFEKKYVSRIMERRINNLTDSEAKSFQTLLSQLEDTSATDKDHLLASLGTLADKADNYNAFENETEDNMPDGEMYAAIWPQADDLRSTGKLALALGKLKCSVVVIHGDYDPHPIEGIIEPLNENGVNANVHVLSKCGHSPFKEKHAIEQFYSILSSLL
ncbi:alpha/beta hydrolase [Christensenellaceae bacterium OttesenSCG-928-L17]|nr:alpha/beta hydrolase [Christensenellaceae bacterium OttesenSCG-928-L17]